MNVTTYKSCAAAVVAALWLAGCGGGGGGGGSTSAPTPPVNVAVFTNSTLYSTAPDASLAVAPEITSVTRQQITIDGAALSYTATVGHLNALTLGTGAARASFFYVAYTLDGAAPATRPVTFFYNGGPGSATVWLHLGSFGPKRLATGMPATNAASPYALIDNAESLLDVTDLVFVDAIGSGYSEAIAPSLNRNFWSVDSDAVVFRDFVMRYVNVNNRSSSPKFLYGESYGGLRSGVLAEELETAGTSLRGVVLQSPVMNYNSNCDMRTAPCTGFIPSYGATATWFSMTVPIRPPAETLAFMAEMRPFAANEYEPAVLNAVLGIPVPSTLLDRLQATTGLRRSWWELSLSRGPTFYRANLNPGTMYGRYDTRVTLPGNGTSDPSSTVISPSFEVRIIEYLRNDLRYTNPSTYVTLSNAIQTWNFAHDGLALPDTIPDLAAAITLNPRLKVLAVNGYHDVATPFFTTERDLARLGNNANVQVRNYMGGHMTYLDDNSRRQMKSDLAAWYRSANAN